MSRPESGPPPPSSTRVVTTDAIDLDRRDPTLNDRIRVLLISDELMTRAGLRHLLEAWGMIVIAETAAGEDALCIMRQERPHIVLLDAPSSSGASTFFQQLTSENVRLILLCERAQPVTHDTCLDVGAMGLVMKDEPPAVLLKAIRKVHQGEAWFDRVRTAEVIARGSRRKRVEDAEQAKIVSLTAREREIIALLGDGLRNEVIAGRLFISQATVRNHLTSILDKLGVSNRFELAVYAFRHGLVHYVGVASSMTTGGDSVSRR